MGSAAKMQIPISQLSGVEIYPDSDLTGSECWQIPSFQAGLYKIYTVWEQHPACSVHLCCPPPLQTHTTIQKEAAGGEAGED